MVSSPDQTTVRFLEPTILAKATMTVRKTLLMRTVDIEEEQAVNLEEHGEEVTKTLHNTIQQKKVKEEPVTLEDL